MPAANSPELDRYFTLYIANGVTTIRGMLGRPSHIGLVDDLEQGTVFGPRLVTSGPSVNGRSVNGPESAREMVREQHAAGYDFIKIHPGPDAEEFEDEGPLPTDPLPPEGVPRPDAVPLDFPAEEPPPQPLPEEFE